MAVDHIRYDILAQEALRGVVRTVLADAAKNGLPGDHHFYITFNIRAEGVRVPPRLVAQFPEEMTIVLQHQFWDLAVNDSGFEVGMSFGGIPERLCIPFAAIKGFVDPSVQFGVTFETLTEAEAGAAAPGKPTEAKPARPPAKHKSAGAKPKMPATPKPANPPDGAAATDASPKPAGSADVVQLDRFRKK
jgi:uncharacterized protein